MSYSQKTYPNDEAVFPRPPEWLVWYGSYAGGAREGQIRHYDTLTKAKKHVSTYNNAAFYSDWAIYHWNGEKYTRQYDGKQGEQKNDNPLFQERIPAGTSRPREVDEDDMQAAIASILKQSDG